MQIMHTYTLNSPSTTYECDITILFYFLFWVFAKHDFCVHVNSVTDIILTFEISIYMQNIFFP